MNPKFFLCLSFAGLLLSCSPAPSGAPSISLPSLPDSQSGVSSSNGKTSSSGQGESSAAASAETSLPQIDYVKIFAPKEYDRVWAWYKEDGRDVNYFDCGWPGEALNSYDDTWKTFDFADRQDIYVIVSQKGLSKSSDYQITSPGYWWYYEGSWSQKNPLAPAPSSSSETGDNSEASVEPYIPPEPGTLDNTHRTWYQLLVYSFADGSGDGIGDFKGIVDHLDYLQKLGIRGIWLSPIHKASSYHSYDVLDYKSVNPEYEEGGVSFAKLLEECHKRDIRVLLDMVLNHTSEQHPWKRDHPDWYTGEHVFSGMPDLNYDKKEVRAAIKDVGSYWLKKGVDGFRCDGAAWIYGGGGLWQVEQNNFSKTIEWWGEFSSAMKAIKKDVYLVGECWTDLQYVEQFASSGMNAFNFSASYWAKDAMQSGNASKWAEEVQGHQKRLRDKNPSAVEASFLSNHDVKRFASNDLSLEKLKLSNALNAISPGGSFVYYGDELGMTAWVKDGYDDMSYRTPMPFKSGATNSQSYMGKQTGYETKSGKSADEDASNANSMYGSLASVIHYKNSVPALYGAAVERLGSGSDNVGVLRYETGEVDRYLVINAGDSEKNVTLSEEAELELGLATSGAVVLNGKTLKIPSYSFAVVSAGSLQIQA